MTTTLERSPTQKLVRNKAVGTVVKALDSLSSLSPAELKRELSAVVGESPRSPKALLQGVDRFRAAIVSSQPKSARGPASTPASAPVTRLSLSELKLLQGISEGLLVREIAQRWGVPAATVRSHLRSLLAKRKVANSEAGQPPDDREIPVENVLPGLLQSKQILEPAEFIERMGWTRQALSKALQANRVFFLESGTERFYPAFYADRRFERRHLEAVTKVLGDLPGGSKWMFFTTPKGSLSKKTPLEALAQGKLADVKASAEAFAE